MLLYSGSCKSQLGCWEGWVVCCKSDKFWWENKRVSMVPTGHFILACVKIPFRIFFVLTFKLHLHMQIWSTWWGARWWWRGWWPKVSFYALVICKLSYIEINVLYYACSCLLLTGKGDSYHFLFVLIDWDLNLRSVSYLLVQYYVSWPFFFLFLF